MSSITATKLVIACPSMTGAIEANSQYNSPFFFLFSNSPRQTPPDRIVFHSSAYRSGGVWPDLSIRGF
jgi:hypothetical protein